MRSIFTILQGKNMKELRNHPSDLNEKISMKMLSIVRREKYLRMSFRHRSANKPENSHFVDQPMSFVFDTVEAWIPVEATASHVPVDSEGYPPQWTSHVLTSRRSDRPAARQRVPLWSLSANPMAWRWPTVNCSELDTKEWRSVDFDSLF